MRSAFWLAQRAGSHARAAPVEIAKALDLDKADIFE